MSSLNVPFQPHKRVSTERVRIGINEAGAVLTHVRANAKVYTGRVLAALQAPYRRRFVSMYPRWRDEAAHGFGTNERKGCYRMNISAYAPNYVTGAPIL